MKRIIALTLAVTAGSVAAFASDNAALDADTLAAISTQITDQGYQIVEIEAEDGGYEVEARKDGALYELTLDADLKVIDTELEDDDD
ncbi:PepSY domain-containing protein [Roseovarius phycicola]|uniref:PepSY domain-containing protein n=1 Tax=Roseovarius phycicola TaxID=3080976 RepID=A0ABZ2HD65_9RHOB